MCAIYMYAQQRLLIGDSCQDVRHLGDRRWEIYLCFHEDSDDQLLTMFRQICSASYLKLLCTHFRPQIIQLQATDHPCVDRVNHPLNDCLGVSDTVTPRDQALGKAPVNLTLAAQCWPSEVGDCPTLVFDQKVATQVPLEMP